MLTSILRSILRSIRLDKILKRIGLFLFVIALAALGLGYYMYSQGVSSGDDYRPESATPSTWSYQPAANFGEDSRLGPARARDLNGCVVIHLKGGPYEMGYQHGRLLRQEVKTGTVPVFARPLDSQPELRDRHVLSRRLLQLWLEYKVYGPIERHTPRPYLEELKGIADGADLDFETVFTASFLSDLTMAMLPSTIGRKLKALGAGECSSLAVSGPATADGRLLFGRNTDYSGQGRWSNKQTVFFYEPDQGYKYVRVSTAGLIKCNSAMNEKQIVVGGHFMGFDGSSPEGWSFTVLEHEIMRRAGTLDEAVRIIKDAPRGGAFGLVVADGKTGRAAVVEAAGDRIGVREMTGGRLFLTNFATTPELEKVDLLQRRDLALRDVMGRYQRLDALSQELFGRLNPENMAAVMGDRVDAATGEERGMGFSICTALNVTSAVFQPETGLFWVAVGPEPACGNQYWGLDFWAEFENRAPENPPGVLNGYQWESPRRAEGVEAYLAALINFRNWPDEHNPILAELIRARSSDPGEPTYYRIQALYRLHRQEYVLAEELLQRALTLPQSNNERALGDLMLGMIYDLTDRRDAARTLYGQALNVSAKNTTDRVTSVGLAVTASARHWLETPFTREHLNLIPLKFHPETGFE